jgi:hypothetical protein
MLFQSSGRFSIFPNIFKISIPFYGKQANLNIIRKQNKREFYLELGVLTKNVTVMLLVVLAEAALR